MIFKPAFSDIGELVADFIHLAAELNETSEAFAAYEGTTVAALRAVPFNDRHEINMRYFKWLDAGKPI